MRDRLKQSPIKCFCFTLIFPVRYGLQSCTQQLVDLLRVCTVFIQKIGQICLVVNQTLAPLLSLVMTPFKILILTFKSIQLGFKGFSFCVTHQLADELHLPSSCFMFFRWNATIKSQGFRKSLIAKLNAFELTIRQFSQFFSKRLQCQHFAFLRTFGGSIKGLFQFGIFLFKGASICHVYRV